MNQPGSLVPGQEPAPSYPPVPSPPEFQSPGSPETTEKEIGTVSPMRVCLGNMLGKGCGVGRIAASVVRWARAVPLGIKHDLRRVGGLCARAPNRYRTAPVHQRFPGPPSRRRGRGSTVEVVLPEHCCSYGSQPGCLWGPFWLF